MNRTINIPSADNAFLEMLAQKDGMDYKSNQLSYREL